MDCTSAADVVLAAGARRRPADARGRPRDRRSRSDRRFRVSRLVPQQTGADLSAEGRARRGAPSVHRTEDKPQWPYCIIPPKSREFIGTVIAASPGPAWRALSRRLSTMSEAVFRRESAVEYFKELVEGALAHQGVDAGELTSFYVVHLLTGFLQRPRGERRRAAGAETGGGARIRRLRQRTTPEADRRRLAVHLRLLFRLAAAQAGRRRLLRHHRRVRLHRVEPPRGDTFSPVFAELATKFPAFVDVLSEVSERTACTSNADLLRLYEKWLKTGSRRSGQLLIERGVVPNASIKTSRIQ